MDQFRFGDLGYHEFDWPECLVVDLLFDHYRAWVDRDDCIVLAKLQQRALHDLYNGDTRRSASTRRDLIDYATGHGLDLDLVDRADRLVFWDLIKLVKVRFRTSPRSRVAMAERLYQALGRLVEDPLPARPPVAVPHPAVWRSQASVGLG